MYLFISLNVISSGVGGGGGGGGRGVGGGHPIGGHVHTIESSAIENSCITKYVYRVLNKIINQSINQLSSRSKVILFNVELMWNACSKRVRLKSHI